MSERARPPEPTQCEAQPKASRADDSENGEADSIAASANQMSERARPPEPRPYTLVAELTYACPLRCVYCSNPLDYGRHRDALDTGAWQRVFQEAEDLGVVQLNLTGGEPLLRKDLEALIEEARRLDLYTNLITSGIPLTRERLARFRALGLDNVQISIQDVTAASSDRIAGRRSFDRKLEVARWVKELGFPLTLNTVLHRHNLASVADVIALAETLSADRLELANTQYLGWALANRRALLPTRAQLEEARAIAAAARRRLRGAMEVLFVTPDYYSPFPKACMDGWGRRFIVVSPDGLALPCHAAHTLPGLRFDTVQERSLQEIWLDSPGFNAFRGEAWMPEPCRSCERRTIDFGGCRCQAFHLTGDAAVTDPACSLSPDHKLIEDARALASGDDCSTGDFVYRSHAPLESRCQSNEDRKPPRH
jgi:PqqA peptide cyclase